MQATQPEEKHLFVDDLDLARQVNTTRRVHGAAKLDRPVLEADLPWEQGGIYGGVRDRRVYVYGTVQRDSPDAPFRLWYGGLNGAIYYAESHDGIAWRRPELGLVDYQGSRRNNLLPLNLHSHIGPGGGLVETAAVRQPTGDGCLKVNAKVRDGALTVELLGGNGEPLAGFGRSDCLAVQGDSVRHVIAWKTRRHLPAATPFRLRFEAGDADLFSYTVEKCCRASV